MKTKAKKPAVKKAAKRVRFPKPAEVRKVNAPKRKAVTKAKPTIQLAKASFASGAAVSEIVKLTNHALAATPEISMHMEFKKALTTIVKYVKEVKHLDVLTHLFPLGHNGVIITTNREATNHLKQFASVMDEALNAKLGL